MANMPFEKRAAHREAAEALARKAVEHIESARNVGGPCEYGYSSRYRRALFCLRMAAEQLRLSEARPD